ncbi:helicase DnaB-like [Bacillus phage Moonbeam]|uniref:Helicase n=1 Tax=Bacillus phage Moonbeam TaxID=1540091 RepID=A0A0A0RSK0_9CAUD|nr:helicase DnaB-like [Bacillus phage Moonbeam]AIW03491.1 helicase [Bacillus phage Moonbeam]
MSSPIRREILRKAIESPTFSKEILPKTPLTIYDGDKVFEEISNIVKRYYQTNGSVLTEEALLTLTEEKLDRLRRSATEQQDYFNVINSLYEIRDSHDDSVIDENIEKYIKKHMRLDLMQRALASINDEAMMDKVDKEWREIELLDITGKQNEIINIIDDVEAKREALSSLHANTIPTGFPDVDNLMSGGLAKGELGLILALSGTGKTLVLTNLATNYTKQKKNVLFIALEETQNRMILKFEQSMLRQNKSNILTGTALNEENFNKYQDFYKQNRQHFGNLFFARYSPRTVTPAKIEQLLSDIKIRQGIEVDVLLIDYPDLLRNPYATGNESDDGGKLFEEIRRICQDYNVLGWTAGQLNRTAYSAAIKTAEHMEGSVRKKNAVEFVGVVQQSEEEFRAGFTRLYIDKLRNTPEGPYEKMLGFKVVGSAQSMMPYRSDAERREHMAIIEEVQDNLEKSFKTKKKNNDGVTVDYAKEMNETLLNKRRES